MEEITLQDVLLFITEHCDDVNTMDKINKMTFPFTSSYTYHREKKISRQKKINWSDEGWDEE